MSNVKFSAVNYYNSNGTSKIQVLVTYTGLGSNPDSTAGIATCSTADWANRITDALNSVDELRAQVQRFEEKERKAGERDAERNEALVKLSEVVKTTLQKIRAQDFAKAWEDAGTIEECVRAQAAHGIRIWGAENAAFNLRQKGVPCTEEQAHDELEKLVAKGVLRAEVEIRCCNGHQLWRGPAAEAEHKYRLCPRECDHNHVSYDDEPEEAEDLMVYETIYVWNEEKRP